MYGQKFEFRTRDYYTHLYLRDELLRKPHGLCVLDDDLSDDKVAQYFGCFNDDGTLIGGCFIVEKDGIFVLRQMVVDPAYQGQNAGRVVVEYAEKELAQQKPGGKILLEARVTAQGFYKKLGYTECSGRYMSEHTGTEHIKMEKTLGDL